MTGRRRDALALGGVFVATALVVFWLLRQITWEEWGFSCPLGTDLDEVAWECPGPLLTVEQALISGLVVATLVAGVLVVATVLYRRRPNRSD